jgi:hypothetical protein
MPESGIRLWLKGDAVAGPGFVNLWPDQSVNQNHATQYSLPSQPQVIAGAINGYPVVHFDDGSTALNLPNLMAGAIAGEVFAVLRATSTGDQHHGLWHFGAEPNGTWLTFDGNIWDNFGSTTRFVPGSPTQSIYQFLLYNVSSQAGGWVSRINGIPNYVSMTNTVGFSTTPILGRNTENRSFNGDIAEVLIYDHTLSTSERQAVEQYLTVKYALTNAPTAPTNLSAQALGSSQVSVTWNAPLSTAITYYNIERETSGGCYTLIATIPRSQSYLDDTVTAGGQYTYRVKAWNYTGMSGYSNEANVGTPMDTSVGMPESGIRLWLKGDAVAGPGFVNLWPDQSVNQNHATQYSVTSQPQVVAGAINGFPVVHFDDKSTVLNLPNLMAGATAGEVFAVLRANPAGAQIHGLWDFGAEPNGAWLTYDGNIWENFGSTTRYITPVPAFPLTQFNIYNVSSQLNEWVSRFNGNEFCRSLANSPGFATTPMVGRNTESASFNGDFAEIIIYDHVLTDEERGSVSAYLAEKYSLEGPTPETPAVEATTNTVTSEVALNWSPSHNTVYYSIERRVSTWNFVQIATVPALLNASTVAYIDSAAPNQDIVQYRIRAIGLGVTSGYSNLVSALRSPNAVDPNTGVSYSTEVALGLDPTVNNAGFFTAAPVPSTPVSPPTPDPTDHTPPVVILMTPAEATLN